MTSVTIEPGFAAYEKTAAGRQIPVIVLEDPAACAVDFVRPRCGW